MKIIGVFSFIFFYQINYISKSDMLSSNKYGTFELQENIKILTFVTPIDIKQK